LCKIVDDPKSQARLKILRMQKRKDFRKKHCFFHRHTNKVILTQVCIFRSPAALGVWYCW